MNIALQSFKALKVLQICLSSIIRKVVNFKIYFGFLYFLLSMFHILSFNLDNSELSKAFKQLDQTLT